MIELSDIYRQKRSPKQLPRKALRRLEEALDLFDDEEYDEGYLLLLELMYRFPESVEVLSTLIQLGIDSEDWSLIARYGRRLLPYLRGEERAIMLNNMIVAYSALEYPGLAYEATRALLAQHTDYLERDNVRELAAAIEAFLQQEAINLIGDVDMSPEEKYAVAIANDWVRFHLEAGELEEAVRIGEPLMKRLPEAYSVHNNVSLAQFGLGHEERAVQIAEQVLERMPDNFHALGNLVRFTFLAGQFDKAEAYAARLKEVRHSSPGLEAKLVEALAYLGDDEGIRAAYRRAKRKGGPLSPLILHLAATAHYRLGDEKAAWRLWQEAVTLDPLMHMAQECLDDRNEDEAHREVPWYWPPSYWFPKSLHDDLQPLVGPGTRRLSDKRFERRLKQVLEKYGYLEKLVPHILDRGDGVARRLAFFLAQELDSEQMAQELYAFARGRFGSGSLRLEVMQYLSERHPQLLPADGKVRMWMRGEEKEMFLLNYEIYFEGEPPEDRSKELVEKDIRVIELLTEERAEEAEALLKEMIEADPDFPSAYNQLAVAYDMQGRREEAKQLGREILERFPDYFFARANGARILAQEGQLGEAKELIEPLLQQKRLHITEFRALAAAQMEILLGEKNRDAARSWLNMWIEIDSEDDPNIVHWRRRIEGPKLDEIGGFLKTLWEQQSKKGKRS